MLEHLVDPSDGTALILLDPTLEDTKILSGRLCGASGNCYPIHRGIPRFVRTADEGQRQTERTFAFKWKRRETYDSPAAKAVALRWYLTKYGFESVEDWALHLGRFERMLDLGCGSGFSSSLFLESAHWRADTTTWVGVDISEAIDVAQERLGHVPRTGFVQADALALPFQDEAFDVVFSEGVLHHTPSTRDALISGARVLRPHGEFHFYVYKKKGPVREFTDDFVRERIAGLSDDEAWEEMRSLTSLGQALSELEATVEVTRDVPLLGIAAGKHDVQRLIYWHFAKLFWNSEMSFEENVHVNFDWYRPRYAHRQTAGEVRSWVEAAGLRIDRLCEDEAGLTVRATKLQAGPDGTFKKRRT